jgi:hypothetical protein
MTEPIAWVEIFGAIGCGKTTLLRAIARNAGSDTIRIFKAERPRLAARKLLADRRPWGPLMAGVAEMLPKSLLAYAVAGYARPIDFEKLAKGDPSIRCFVSDVLFERPRVPNDPILSLRRMHWFIRDLSDLCLLREFGDPGRYLFDESLIMRGIGFGFGAGDPEAALDRYLRNLPLPSAAIYLTADLERMKRQIEKRDGKNAPKLARCAESIELAELMYKKVAGRIPVLRLRTEHEGDLVSHCDTVLDFLRDLGADRISGHAQA